MISLENQPSCQLAGREATLQFRDPHAHSQGPEFPNQDRQNTAISNCLVRAEVVGRRRQHFSLFLRVWCAGDNAGWADLFGQALQSDGAVEPGLLNRCCECCTCGGWATCWPPLTAAEFCCVADVCVCAHPWECVVLQAYPESCDCAQTELKCVEVHLQDVPQVSPNVTWL